MNLLTAGAIVAIGVPGRLNAWVRTASAKFTDLGRSFGVVASGSGSSQFVVLDGEVEVAKEDAEKIRLTQCGDLRPSGYLMVQSQEAPSRAAEQSAPTSSGRSTR